MEWSWTTWLLSVAAVVVSGAIAWREGHWRRSRTLAMGFADHGGMWSDLLLLPLANAVIVPHLSVDWWIAPALLMAVVASLWVHWHWYRAPRRREDAQTMDRPQAGDHMWAERRRGTWWDDLTAAGWAHVLYVAGELTLLIGCLLHAMPTDVTLLVGAIFTIHVPIGLLQPRYFLTRHIATMREQPLLLPCLVALWAVVAFKLS